MVCGCISMDNIPSGLDVNLFGEEFFQDGQYPCDKELYEAVLGGEGVDGQQFEWTYDVSYHMMLQHCHIESDLKAAFPPLTPFQLIRNWLILLLGIVCFFFPGLYYLVILAQSGEKTEAAAMLMAKRAYDLERVALQTARPDARREEDVIVHHLLCAYYQRYVEISNEHNPFTTFFQFRGLCHVDSFLSEEIGRYLIKYGWIKLSFRQKVLSKAKAHLNHPTAGRTTGMICLAAILFAVYVLLLVGMSFTGNRSLIVFGSILLIIDVVLTILYLGTWVPVTRRVAGLTRQTFRRWEEGRISEDEIGGVTDLALLAIRYSEAESRPEGRVSEHWWISLLHVSERPAAPSSQKSSPYVEVSVKLHNAADSANVSMNLRVKSGRSEGTFDQLSTHDEPPPPQTHRPQDPPRYTPTDTAQHTGRLAQQQHQQIQYAQQHYNAPPTGRNWRYDRDPYQQAPRVNYNMHPTQTIGAPAHLPRIRAGSPAHHQRHPDSPTNLVVHSPHRAHPNYFSYSHSGPQHPGTDIPSLAPPPMARNAESMGLSQAQLDEIFNQGYMQGRRQQQGTFMNHRPVV